MSLVTLQYQDLLAGKDLTAEVYRAFGAAGLGALTIAGVPSVREMRERLLPQSYRLAHLPREKLAKLEDAKSLYNAGWSHGKEKLGPDPDYAKGSFYANPLYDVPSTPAMRDKYPSLYACNIWPRDDLPDLEPAFKTLGRTMYEVVLLLSKQVDTLVHRAVPTYAPDTLYTQMQRTQKIKGRLLYYYPTESDAEDNWIGWHNDSGFLTALTGGLFFDDDTGQIIENPDPTGGLWIIDRGHEPVHVKIGPDQIGVQCGECLQIISGGHLVATPHSVRSSKSPSGRKVGRATFPVFIDTEIDFPLSVPKGVTRERVFDRTIQSKVPPLDTRWRFDGQIFADFLSDTFAQYYEWDMGKAAAAAKAGKSPAAANGM